MANHACPWLARGESCNHSAHFMFCHVAAFGRFKKTERVSQLGERSLTPLKRLANGWELGMGSRGKSELDLHPVVAQFGGGKDAAGGGEADGIGGVVLGIEVGEDEAPGAGGGGDLSDGGGAGVAGLGGPFFLPVGKVALVHQTIDPPNGSDIRGVGRGGGVGNIGQRAIGPVEAKANGAAGMVERKMGDSGAADL